MGLGLRVDVGSHADGLPGAKHFYLCRMVVRLSETWSARARVRVIMLGLDLRLR